MDNINVYKVSIIKLDIGCRIESFHIKSCMFQKKESALAFAYSEAKKYHDEYYIYDKDKKLIYNEKGIYFWPHNGYSWNEFEIYIESDVVNLSDDVMNVSEFSA
jgi:hypothetical protein